MVLGGLASAATLAQSPSPTPTATATPVGCDFPTPTPAPGETPYPGSTATAAPTAPTDLRAELVADPELASGLAVQLSWQDNADNETCYQVMVRIDGEPLRAHGGFVPYDASTTGPQTLKDIPDRTGLHCYQVYYGNSAGRSYSNEACIDVQAVPVVLTPTPPTGTMTPVSGARQLPPACLDEGPVGSPGSPSPPTNLRAELVSSPIVLEGLLVRLQWDDNADNELCYVIERKVGEGDWSVYEGGSGPSTGLVSLDDVPGEVGIHCYRVSYGNYEGRSAYSNEACVDVQVVPIILTPTPPVRPATPSPGPMPSATPLPWPCNAGDDPPYSELAPSPPTDLAAIVVPYTAYPGIPAEYRVELLWQSNAVDPLCYIVQRWEHDDAWRTLGGRGFGRAFGSFDPEPWLGVRCYRVAVTNEHGRSEWSNEACATGPAVVLPSTPASTATPTREYSATAGP
jgi:hypothetical protein